MSEAEAVENAETTTETAEGAVTTETTETTEAPATSAKHMSKDEWVAKGNDAADYKTPEQFDEAGKWIKITKGLRREMDEMKQSMETRHEDQIKGLNQLHSAQLQTQVQQLTAKRDAAIDDLDKDGAQAAQTEIDNVYANQPAPAQQAQAQPTKDPSVAEWERDNPWIMERSEKTAFANARMNTYLQGGYSMGDALKSLDGDIARTYPATNANRNAPANTETGGGPGQKVASKALTMGDLTSEESKQYVPSMWETEQKFLDAVANSRKG